MPARYHLIGALVIDRHAANACVYRRSRADCNELISAAGRGSAIFLPFTLFSPSFPRFRTVQPTPFRPKTVENDLDISWREREGNWVAGEEVSSSSIH